MNIFKINEERIKDNKFNYIIIVNGGNPFVNGSRVEHGDPHFHFYDIKKSGYIDMSVFIPSVGEWLVNKELYIFENSKNNLNWNGMKKEKNELIKWLDSTNNIINSYTNLEYIRYRWNFLNIYNKNVKQFVKIK